MPDEPQPPQPAEASPVQPVRRRSLWRRIRPLATIALAILTPIYTIKEIVHTVHELPEQPQSGFAVSFKSGVDNQLRQLNSVDPIRLGGVFEQSLRNYNCSWFFSCSPIEQQYQTLNIGALAARMPVAAGQLRLAYRFGPIFIPTWHTVSGTPRAIRDMSVQIAHSGYWAIAMFLACSVFWLVLLVRCVRGDQLLAAWCGLMVAPFAISCCVYLVQHLCLSLLHLFGVVGGFMALLVTAMVHGTAMALIVGFNHLFKSPQEFAEGVHKLKAV
jgi:hypothetical protein